MPVSWIQVAGRAGGESPQLERRARAPAVAFRQFPSLGRPADNPRPNPWPDYANRVGTVDAMASRMASSHPPTRLRFLGPAGVTSLLLVMSCGGSMPSDNTGDTLDTFCSANIDASCDWGRRCGEATADLGICRTALAELYDGCPQMVALAKQGKSHFDGAAAARYIVAVRNRTCSSEEGPALDEVFSGDLGEGQACTNLAECAKESVCIGTCQRLRGAGEICSEMSNGGAVHPCGHGLQCDFATALCASAPAQTFGAAGDACTGSLGGFSTCAFGLACSVSGVCTPKSDVGGACTVNPDCRLGLVCVANTASAKGATCQVPRAVGAPCSSTGECESHSPEYGVCENGRCTTMHQPP